MLLDTHDNLPRYASLFCGVDPSELFRWLRDCETIDPGTEVDFLGDKLFVRMLRPATCSRENMRWETHREYVDLQYIVGGGELIEWAPVSQLATSGGYDPVKDVQFYAEYEPSQTLVMPPGLFVFFTSTDAHKPQVADGTNSFVHKAVVKIHRSLFAI
jgi:biofilm protein TabA